MRLLHYPPVPDAEGGAIRAGAHEDINLITLLLGAEEAGLELLTKDGRWIGVSRPTARSSSTSATCCSA
jgi:isopenicillin N synthase-like dioxygenase